MVKKDKFPRYDVQKYTQLIMDIMPKALADLKKLGVTHAIYSSLPHGTTPENRDFVARIEIPVDQFPYKSTGVDVRLSGNANEFNLTMRIANGTVLLEAEMTIDELLTSEHQGILDALCVDAVLKLVNSLEKWINDHHRYIQINYQEDPARMKWHLTEPDLLRRKQMYKDLHSVLARKIEGNK